MARSSSFFGLRRGSTKSLTFSVLDGQQITKDRVVMVRNPKTESQQIQRIIMNTAMQAYSVLKPICDHAFEGFAYGAKNQAEFMRLNLHDLRQKVAAAGANFGSAVAFCPLKYKFIALNEYKISSGRLPKVTPTEDGEIFADANTYESIILTHGLQRGDQLTFLVLNQTMGDPANVTFDYARVILDPVDEFGKPLPLNVEFAKADGSINGANPRNNSTAKFHFAHNAQALSFGLGVDIPAACAVIVSRENVAAKTWLRSPAHFVVSKQSKGMTMAEALAASQQQVNPANPYYLNGSTPGAEVNLPYVESLSRVLENVPSPNPGEPAMNASIDIWSNGAKNPEFVNGGIAMLWKADSGTQTFVMRGKHLDQLNVTFKDHQSRDLVQAGILIPSVDYTSGRKWVLKLPNNDDIRVCHFEATTADGTVVMAVDVPAQS